MNSIRPFPISNRKVSYSYRIPSLSTVIYSAIATLPLPDLSTADAAVVSAYLQDIINQKYEFNHSIHSIILYIRRPDLSQLSDEQLNVLIASILELKAEYEVRKRERRKGMRMWIFRRKILQMEPRRK